MALLFMCDGEPQNPGELRCVMKFPILISGSSDNLEMSTKSILLWRGNRLGARLQFFELKFILHLGRVLNIFCDLSCRKTLHSSG